MDTASLYPAALTSTFITLRACVRDINPARLTREQVALLHEIANFAFANAQEACLLEADRDLAICDERDALAAERLMAESDAVDHQIAHLV